MPLSPNCSPKGLIPRKFTGSNPALDNPPTSPQKVIGECKMVLMTMLSDFTHIS